MITRVVKMTFNAADVEKFLEIFKSTEEFIRSFNGCHSVNLLMDAGNENVYFTLSTWRSEGDLNTYRSSALFKETWAKVKPLFSERAEAWSLIDINPQ
jgi:quinol monooxygenase YgiN